MSKKTIKKLFKFWGDIRWLTRDDRKIFLYIMEPQAIWKHYKNSIEAEFGFKGMLVRWLKKMPFPKTDLPPTLADILLHEAFIQEVKKKEEKKKENKKPEIRRPKFKKMEFQQLNLFEKP